jgi:hypothetical protein
LIRSASLPVGACFSGLRHCQKKLWFQIWAELLNRPLSPVSLALEALFGHEAVGLVDIGLVMLAVVEFERLRRHVRGERTLVIGQRGKFESHGDTPCSVHPPNEPRREAVPLAPKIPSCPANFIACDKRKFRS